MTKQDGATTGAGVDRLAAAAALAGTVAHDLGNMLTVMLGNAELLIEGLADRPELLECATLMLVAAQKGTELTERLDRFSRRIGPEGAPADASAVLGAFVRRMRAELPEGIAFEAEVAAGLPAVPVPAAALTLALDELVRNAVTALGGKGRIGLSAERAGAGRISVTVWDDGPGLAPETLRRVQEMRFTSGIAGHKTGLGLAVARRVVSAGGGTLDLESAPGAGTRIILGFATVG